MLKKSSTSNPNPFRALRTATEFLSICPGATCQELKYSADLSAFFLKLADGSTFVVAGNEKTAWDRGVEMLENGCLARTTRVANASTNVAYS